MNLCWSIKLSTPSRSAFDAKKRKEAKGERGQRKPAKGREPSPSSQFQETKIGKETPTRGSSSLTEIRSQSLLIIVICNISCCVLTKHVNLLGNLIWKTCEMD